MKYVYFQPQGVEALINQHFMRLIMNGAYITNIGRSGNENRELVFAFNDGHTIVLEADHNGYIQFKRQDAQVELDHLCISGATGKF